MSIATETKINPHGHGAPSDWIVRHLDGIPVGGTVLDIACGAGRNLRAALAAGHPVVGVDRDVSGLADLDDRDGVEIVARDIEAAGGLPLPLGGRRFAGVIVTNYLYRPLFPFFAELVAADGVLLYETFARSRERHGRPSNPAFLLAPNELLSGVIAAGLTPIAFEHGEVTAAHGGNGRDRVVERVAAVGAAHPWISERPRRLVPSDAR